MPDKPINSIELVFYIRGLQHGHYEYLKDNLENNCILAAIREPENPYDKNAIGLYFMQHKLGYVPKKKAALIVGQEHRDGVHYTLKCKVLRHFKLEPPIFKKVLCELTGVA